MTDFDRFLDSPWLLFGLFAALVVALGALAWMAVGHAEVRARTAQEKAALELAFSQLHDANTSIAARRDLLEQVVAAIPAGLELRDGAGRIALQNAGASAADGLPGAGDIRRLPDGGLLEVRRVTLSDGGELALFVEIEGHRSQPGPSGEAAAQAIAPSAPAALTAHRRRRALVLLVEDIPVNQVVTVTALRRDGHRVDIAGSGPEAVRMAAAAPYELVLMDLMMPGMSGYDATRAIRGLSGVAGHMWIYALTATNAQADRERCRAAGMQGMLTKPVHPQALEDLLTAILHPPGFIAGARVEAANDRLLDAVRLAELQRGLPEGMFAELVDQALGDMSARMGGLQTALAGARADTIVAEAHALAGIAASYGLLAFEQRMRRVLVAAYAGDIGGANDAADGMAAALDGSASALRAMLQTPAPRRATA